MGKKDKSKESVKVYNKIADKYSKAFDNDKSDKIYLDKFISFLPKNGKILDLGSGTGNISNYYSKKGFKVVGVDLAIEMIKIAKENYSNIEFINGDIRNIKFSKNQFDGVCLIYSLIHIEKKEVSNLIKRIKYTLKNKGTLFLILQEGKGERWVKEPLLKGEKIFINLYQENEIKQVLSENGFKIVHKYHRKPMLKEEFPFNKIVIYAQVSKQ